MSIAWPPPIYKSLYNSTRQYTSQAHSLRFSTPGKAQAGVPQKRNFSLHQSALGSMLPSYHKVPTH